MEVQIVPATVEMSEDIAVLCGALGYPTTAEVVRNQLQDILSREDHRFLVAQHNGKAVGFCHGYFRVLVEVPTAVELGGLVVGIGAQGMGIGKKLVQSIEEWAKSNNINLVVLSSNIKRETAHQFYEHLGYTKIKQQFAFEKHL